MTNFLRDLDDIIPVGDFQTMMSDLADLLDALDSSDITNLSNVTGDNLTNALNNMIDSPTFTGNMSILGGGWIRFLSGGNQHIEFNDANDDRIALIHIDQAGGTFHIRRYDPSNGAVLVDLSLDSTSVYIGGQEIWHGGNTTVDVDGFIKEASPIIKLYKDHIIKNDQATGDFRRVSTGHYSILNSQGLAKNGWFIGTPSDHNGNKLMYVDYEEQDNDEIVIKTYSPVHTASGLAGGDPVDIPEGRWIDIRLATNKLIHTPIS